MVDAASGQELLSGNRGPVLVGIQIVMIWVATIAVALRFLARRMSAARIWWDDWIILAALIPSLGINVVNIIAVGLGLGRHIDQVQDHGAGYLKTLFATELIYVTALALNKISVLLMYERIFGIEKYFLRACYAVGLIVVAWWIGVEVATLVQCQPIHKFWNYQSPGQCINIIGFFEGAAILNVVSDIAILLLPQPLIWKLQLSKSKKFLLAGIFLLGAFTAISSIGRLVAIITFKDATDFTWTAFATIIWYSVEPATGILCACLPCMGPLLRRLPGSPFTTTTKSQYGTRTIGSRQPSAHLSVPHTSRHRMSADSASLEKLTQNECSMKTSVYTSASESVQNLTADHEMNVIHVRSSTHITM